MEPGRGTRSGGGRVFTFGEIDAKDMTKELRMLANKSNGRSAATIPPALKGGKIRGVIISEGVQVQGKGKQHTSAIKLKLGAPG